MKIYVVRHGETAWNKEEVFRGRKDVPLNDRGVGQAERTGRFFAGKRISLICSSPLSRARQTASEIGKSCNVAVKIDDAFIDMDFGRWEGLSLPAVRKAFPESFETWRNNPHRFCIEGSETLTRVRSRSMKGLRQAISTVPKDDPSEPVIIIVTHRVICKLLALHFLGVSNRFFWKVKCDPASITLAEQAGGEMVLSMLNQTLHLQEPSDNMEYRDF